MNPKYRARSGRLLPRPQPGRQIPHPCTWIGWHVHYIGHPNPSTTTKVNLKGSRVLITGASSGIGERVALQLAEKGAHLFLTARSEEALESVAQSCRELGVRVDVLPSDVTDPDGCRRIVENAVDALQGLDLIILSAGLSMGARFDEITDLSLFDRIMRVNYLGTVYVTHFALPALKRSRGMIVGLSSHTGLTGVPTRSAYAASKHAVNGFLDSIRIELRPFGVRVLVVSPGPVATAVRSAALGPDGRELGPHLGHTHRQAMPVDVCAAQIIRAIERDRRQLVMTFKARVGRWVRLAFPSLIDRVAEREIGRFTVTSDPG